MRKKRRTEERRKISSVQQLLEPLFDGVDYFERVFTINKRSDERVHISRKLQKSINKYVGMIQWLNKKEVTL